MTDETVKIWVSKKEKLADGGQATYGAETTVPKADVATGLLELKHQFQVLLLPTKLVITVPTLAKPAGPTTSTATSPTSLTAGSPATAPILLNQPADYNGLPWKQSEKKPMLWTMKVTENLLIDPLAKQLYEQTKSLGDKEIKIGEHTYRLSIVKDDTSFYQKGTEFLQRWGKVQVSTIVAG